MNSMAAATSKTTFRRATAGVLVLAAVLPSVTAWLYFVALTSWPAAVQQASYTLGKGLQFALPMVWVFVIQGRRARLNRLRTAGVAQGLVFGAAVFTAIVLGYFACLGPRGFAAAAVEPSAHKLAGFGVDGPAKFIALATFYCVIHSLLEEYYWRWFFFGELREILPLGWAVPLSGLAFAAHHVIVLAAYFGWAHWQPWLMLLCVAGGGAAWAWLYHRSDSLLGPWLSHALVDAAIFTVGYAIVIGRQ